MDAKREDLTLLLKDFDFCVVLAQRPVKLLKLSMHFAAQGGYIFSDIQDLIADVLNLRANVPDFTADIFDFATQFMFGFLKITPKQIQSVIVEQYSAKNGEQRYSYNNDVMNVVFPLALSIGTFWRCIGITDRFGSVVFRFGTSRRGEGNAWLS